MASELVNEHAVKVPVEQVITVTFKTRVSHNGQVTFVNIAEDFGGELNLTKAQAISLAKQIKSRLAPEELW